MRSALADNAVGMVPSLAPSVRPRTQRVLIRLVWIAYAAVIVLVMLHHEPFCDEADVWLAVRDMTLGQLFPWLRYAGSPCLWYLLVMIPAKLGLPYQSMGLLHGLLAMIVAAVILWRAPFPWWIRCLLVLSYYPAYGYAIIARSYVLTELFLVLIAVCYEKRFQRPLLMALLIALLANTNVHGTIFAGVFFLVITGEYILRRRHGMKDLSDHRPDGVLITAMLLAMAGGLLAAGQVFPGPPDGQLNSFLTLRNPGAIDYVLARTYLPGFPSHYDSMLRAFHGRVWLTGIMYVGVRLVGLLAIVAMLCLLRRNRWMLVTFCAVLAGLLYVFVFKWMGNERHAGLVWLLSLTTLWIVKRQGDLNSGVAPPPGRPARWSAALLVATLIWSCLTCWVRLAMDWRWAYSGSTETAQFLIDRHLVGRRIAVFCDTRQVSLLPYMPNQQFWYVGRQAYGTYMI